MDGNRLVGTLGAHVRTWRPYTIWYPGLVGLAGATLAAEPRANAALLAAWFAPTAVWVAAHYLGDYLDRHLDAISKPQRPIPSGRMAPRTALLCGTLLAAAGCAAALAVNWRTILLLAVGIGGALAYNGLFKARGLWGNVVRGALTGAAFAFGTMMTVDFPPVGLLPFVVVFWAHDAASNVVGTLRDVAGDREGGYATFAVRRGLRTAGRTAAALYGLALVTAAFGCLAVPRDRAICLLVVLLAGAVGSTAFGLVLGPRRELTPRTALRAHEVLVAERIVLADALLVPGLGPALALGILVPLLVLTLGVQHRMRSGHEFAPDGQAATAR
ncbi:UbiA family prenyltransferase [Streptomyces sp. NPDC127114]|uniref:UbiA family prenyltransferase n=1 Tax=Streptomyces sp. NPDC127114 TaxID=3345366 RepID=UPI0036270473